MKTMTEKEFCEWFGKLKELLPDVFSGEKSGGIYDIYLNRSIIDTVKIKQERKPLPVDTLIYDADSNNKWYASGNCNTVYQACYFGATTSETAKEHGIISRYHAMHDKITVVSYPGEEAEAWQRVAEEFRYIAECERTAGGMFIPSVQLVFKNKIAEVRAENDAKYGYERAEADNK